MEATEKPLKKRLPAYAVLCFFAAWNVCFYMPMDIYIANANDIEIPIKPLAACLGLVTLGVFAVTFAVCALTKGRANRIIRAVLFGVSVAFYIQGNFLAVKMGTLNGEQYSPPVWRTLLSAAIWLVVLAAAFVLLWKLPEEFDGLVPRVAAALFVVQLVALGISAYQNIPKYGADKLEQIFNGESMYYCSTKDLELYGKNKSVIVIIADEYDSFLFDGALKEDPDSVSEFDGFTYYTNAVGRYRLTTPTLAYITSNGIDDEAYKDLTFYESAAANYKVNFYTDTMIPPSSVLEDFCDNIGRAKLSLGEAMTYTTDVYRLAFFRCMPEPLKPLFWFDGQSIGDGLAKSLERRVRSELGAGLYDCHDLEFYNELPQELSTTDEDVFKFIYIRGIHSPRTVTKDLEPCENNTVSVEDTAIAVNRIVNEYLRILKENGVYDSCEILFMADHGLTDHLDKRFPMLMYKPANQTETGIKVSKAPISYDEMFPTLIKLAGGEPPSRTIFDIAEDEKRTRFFGEENRRITETDKIIESQRLTAES